MQCITLPTIEARPLRVVREVEGIPSQRVVLQETKAAQAPIHAKLITLSSSSKGTAFQVPARRKRLY